MNKVRKKKQDYDFSATAFHVVKEAIEEKSEPVQVQESAIAGKNPHAVALGRLGGKKGGKARAEKLTLVQRTEIARKAAQVRWQKRSGNTNGQ